MGLLVDVLTDEPRAATNPALTNGNSSILVIAQLMTQSSVRMASYGVEIHWQLA
jgi:hypothetical protein